MIYADYAATTPTRPEVLEEMLPFFSTVFGNPSGIHQFAKSARDAIESARERVAKKLRAYSSNEVVFTSGGTESNNLALFGLARGLGAPGDRILISAVEHAAVSAPIDELDRAGYEVVVLPVDSYGMVSPNEVRDHLTDRTVLVSVMMVNNEVGTIQPVREIGELLADHRAAFHSDAIQGVRAAAIDVNDLNLDALSLSAHKFYGPKGVGALWIRSGLEAVPIAFGGGQERTRRSGTENVPGIVGLAKALELTCDELETERPRLRRLTTHLSQELVERISGCSLTGHPVERHPGIASFIIDGTQGESLLIQLDRMGVAASTGSACSTSRRHASKVLAAMGVEEMSARGSLRISIGLRTTKKDVMELADRIVSAVELVRSDCLAT